MFELLKRCNPRGIPVVVFSGSVNPADEERAIKLGAKEFVNKPLQLDDYVQAVWKIIGKWAERQACAVHHQSDDTKSYQTIGVIP